MERRTCRDGAENSQQLHRRACPAQRRQSALRPDWAESLGGQLPPTRQRLGRSEELVQGEGLLYVQHKHVSGE